MQSFAGPWNNLKNTSSKPVLRELLINCRCKYVSTNTRVARVYRNRHSRDSIIVRVDHV